MCGSGRDVGITLATKNPKVVVRWGMTIEGKVRGRVVEGAGGMKVEKVGGGV